MSRQKQTLMTVLYFPALLPGAEPIDIGSCRELFVDCVRRRVKKLRRQKSCLTISC